MSKQVTLTPAQMEALAPQSGQLHRALYAGWAKPIYSPEMAVLQKVWRELTGNEYPMQKGCGRCQLNLLRDLGTLYFATLDANKAQPTTATEKVAKNARKTAKKGK
jgi:hypothetical protein